MLKNWSGQAQDREFFLFAHSIMNFFLRPQLLSPSGARWRVDTCALIFGECATREAAANASSPAETLMQKPTLPAKIKDNRQKIKHRYGRAFTSAANGPSVMALPAVL